MRHWLIQKLGGFPDIQSALTALKTLDNLELKNEILTEGIKQSFTTIGPDDILKPEGDHLTFMGQALTQAQSEQLKQDARTITSLFLWKVLRADIKYQINKKMFEEANDLQALISSKVAFWIDGIYKDRLKSLK